VDLIERWQALTGELGNANVKLLAVSKYAPDAAVQLLIDAGQMSFGESRPQHLRDRAQRWPDCDWHMIGPVQRNKAKYIGRHASMWHSCEALDTAKAVAKHVGDRVLPVLIQVNVAEASHTDSSNKHGIRPADLPAFAAALTQIDGLQIVGLMTMATKDSDTAQTFRNLRGLRDSLLDGSLAGVSSLELCMGMSGDYRVAIAEGSSMVRLGSTLFSSWDVRNRDTRKNKTEAT